MGFFCLNGCDNKSKEQETAQKSTKYAGNKPNIIFLLADDMGYGELGSYGQGVKKKKTIIGHFREAFLNNK